MAPPYSNIENIFANFSPLVGGFPFWPFDIPHNVNAPNCSPASDLPRGPGGNFAFPGEPDSVLELL